MLVSSSTGRAYAEINPFQILSSTIYNNNKNTDKSGIVGPSLMVAVLNNI